MSILQLDLPHARVLDLFAGVGASPGAGGLGAGGRFELVMMAAKRARQLAGGVESKLDNSEANDKPTVLALREIAARMVADGYLWNSGIFVWRASDFLAELRA